MKRYLFPGLLIVLMMTSAQAQVSYDVAGRKKNIRIDGNWDKPAWKMIKAVKVESRMGDEPGFRPETEVKLQYDALNLYVIFRVHDKFVKSTVTQYQGHVSGDSCVEFFFAPNANEPLHYFNLEVNAGGTPLIFFITKPWTGVSKLTAAEISKIEIAHSMPSVVDPEIEEEVTWTIECRVPLEVLSAYTAVTMPRKGVTWRANFYKTASKTSNPHYYTWSPVDNPVPNFHLPEYFGKLAFQ